MPVWFTPQKRRGSLKSTSTLFNGQLCLLVSSTVTVKTIGIFYAVYFHVRYSDWLRAGRSGDRIPVGVRFSAPVQNDPGAHPSSCTMGAGSFPRVKSGWGVTLTPHPLLVPRSRKSKAIPLLPLWAVGLHRASMSVQGCTLPLWFWQWTLIVPLDHAWYYHNVLFEVRTYFYITQICVRPLQGCVIGEAVNRWFVATKFRFQTWFFVCGIFAGQSGTVTEFSSSTLILHQCFILRFVFWTPLNRRANGLNLGTLQQRWCCFGHWLSSKK